jgi:hypothetical protein
MRTAPRTPNPSVPRLETSSAAVSTRAKHCLFQAVAHVVFQTVAHVALSVAVLCLMVAPAAQAQPADPLSRPAAAWQPRRAEDVKAQVFAYLAAKKVDAAVRAKAESLWATLPSPVSEDDLLARLAETYALVNSDAAGLMSLCAQPRNQLQVPSEAWLRKGSEPALFANNLRLLYAQWLVHESLFDEAMEQLARLSPDDVVAPASLLFHQSVVYRALLNKDSGLRSIERLLQGAERSPQRYVALARLMQEDLKGLQDDTLDHIARRMGDIRRRLDLGRAGSKVRKEQDGVIKSLDKMIKKIEDQQQQQAGAASAIQPSSPAQESQIIGGKGPGEVTRKNVGSESGWGNLPPKEREQAMQQIGRDFPSHYRDVIEQYFRRLAAEGATP